MPETISCQIASSVTWSDIMSEKRERNSMLYIPSTTYYVHEGWVGSSHSAVNTMSKQKHILRNLSGIVIIMWSYEGYHSFVLLYSKVLTLVVQNSFIQSKIYSYIFQSGCSNPKIIIFGIFKNSCGR